MSSKHVTVLILCGHADEMSESRQTHVTLHDIDPQALEQLVQYAYTAEIVVGEGNVQVSTRLPSVSLDFSFCSCFIFQCISTCPPPPDFTSCCQSTAAQRGAGRLLQVPPQPAGPLQLLGDPWLC